MKTIMKEARRALVLLAALTLSGVGGFAASPPHPDVGQRLILADVDWTNAVCQTTFDDPAELKDWKLEGGKRMSIENGKLV
ncbi:MAG: hypothetical protein WCL11_28610, partial [Verrucomicrobiota bacterium]